MALDPVPWFTGGGAKHSAAIARNLAWNATGGKTGIATPTSLQVRQLSTAGGAVQIMPGGCVIESTYAGALQQSYTVRNSSATTVTIPANTSSSTVTRYITVEINDPQFAGSKPPSVEDGPYVFFRVLTTRQTIHPDHLLATVVQPPNTSTVTAGMIRDQRVLANPKRETYTLARPRVNSDSGEQKLYAREAAGGEYFPGGGGYANQADIVVPPWAVSMIIEADWMSVRYEGAKRGWGSFWVEYGTEYRANTWPNKQQWEFATQKFAWDQAENSATYRTNWRLMDTRPVPAKIRNKNTTFVFKAANTDTASANTAVASCDAMSGLGMKITFLEAPADWEDFNAS